MDTICNRQTRTHLPPSFILASSQTPIVEKIDQDNRNLTAQILWVLDSLAIVPNGGIYNTVRLAGIFGDGLQSESLCHGLKHRN